ncbi:MAG: hypothetical protein JSW36_14875, partial [Burkholderiales bacterium]
MRTSAAVPPGARVLSVPDGRILPGFIDAGTVLAGDTPALRAVTADARAADGFDPYADRRWALASGVTVAALDPGRRRL